MSGALPCVIDIEASGFGRNSYPIEVGFVDSGGRPWCALVRPQPEWTHWDDAAAGLHLIQRDTLARHGQAVQQVASRLNEVLGGQTVYCDGWAHDYPWLARLFDAAELTPRFRLEPVTRLLGEAQLGQLDTLLARAFPALGINRHRASSDARALQWALGQLLSQPAPSAHQ